MNRPLLCVLLICFIFSISSCFYNKFCEKYLHLNSQEKCVETKNATNKIFNNEDIKYFQEKGWNITNANPRQSSRNKRSLASIANGIWRVLNYPYMYNFYPILNFGVSKIMSGIGYLVSNVHFPLFSTTTNQPLSEAELQAQELAYAQGQALSQEAQTTGGASLQDTSTDSILKQGLTQNVTQAQDYEDSREREQEERAKEREEEFKEKEKMQEVNRKIDEKAEVLARKYVQMYFSKKQQLGDVSQSEQLNGLSQNTQDTNIALPASIENNEPTHYTDLTDNNQLKTDANYPLPNVNLPAYN